MRIEQNVNIATNSTEIKNARNNNVSSKKINSVNYNDGFIKSKNDETLTTYDKDGKDVTRSQIEELKNQSERAYSTLRNLVNQLFKDQNYHHSKAVDMIEISPEIRKEAQTLIAPDGEMGIEAVSRRLVDFAIAISGGDKSEVEQLKKYITQGFKEAEKILGELPEISHKTYEAAISKLDEWAKS